MGLSKAFDCIYHNLLIAKLSSYGFNWNALKHWFKWFSFNNLKANAYKCHLFNSPYQPVTVNVRGSITESSNCEILLEIYTDGNFSFEYHINWICCKASQKVHALSRIVKYISTDKKHKNFHNSTIQLLPNSLDVPEKKFK